MSRFNSHVCFLKDQVDAGKIGTIHYAEVSRVSRCDTIGGWFRDKSKSGGGALIDAAIHQLDAVLYLMGYPKVVSVTGYSTDVNKDLPDRMKGLKTIYASVSNTTIERTIESFASGMIRFENGACLYIRSGHILNTPRTGTSIEICGTKGGALTDLKDMKLVTIEPDDTYAESTTQLEKADGFFAEMKHFVDCCHGRATCINTPQQGTEIMKIITAIYDSAKTGKEIVF